MRNILLFILLGGIAFGEVHTFTCNFKTVATKKSIQKEKLNWVFKYDTISGKAYAEGNSGVSEVTPLKGINSMTFIEMTASGNPMITTISRNGEAVHSRHYSDSLGLLAQQFYGECSW